MVSLFSMESLSRKLFYSHEWAILQSVGTGTSAVQSCTTVCLPRLFGEQLFILHDWACNTQEGPLLRRRSSSARGEEGTWEALRSTTAPLPVLFTYWNGKTSPPVLLAKELGMWHTKQRWWEEPWPGDGLGTVPLWQRWAVTLDHAIVWNLTLRQLQKEEQHRREPGKEKAKQLLPHCDFSDVTAALGSYHRWEESGRAAALHAGVGSRHSTKMKRQSEDPHGISSGVSFQEKKNGIQKQNTASYTENEAQNKPSGPPGTHGTAWTISLLAPGAACCRGNVLLFGCPLPGS